MNAKTAVSEKMIKETTSNEAMRRLLNTLPFQQESEENAVAALNDYMREMQASGYDERARKQVLTNTLTGYKRKINLCGDPCGDDATNHGDDDDDNDNNNDSSRDMSKSKRNLYCYQAVSYTHLTLPTICSV